VHVPLEGLAERSGKVFGVDRLDDVRGRAATQRRLDQVRARRRGEHHDLHVGVAPLDLVQAGETVHMRHAHVEQHEVRIRPSDERQHLRSGLRLADDLEVAVLLERTANSVKDETMVVGDHDSHRHLSVAQGRDGDVRPSPG
jgi:hypothetical protein